MLINACYMKQWRTPKKGHSYAPASIESGDAGIWVTCDKNKEGLCTMELKDIFEEVRITPTYSRLRVFYWGSKLGHLMRTSTISTLRKYTVSLQKEMRSQMSKQKQRSISKQKSIRRLRT